jgi:hypothetical protein
MFMNINSACILPLRVHAVKALIALNRGCGVQLYVLYAFLFVDGMKNA